MTNAMSLPRLRSSVAPGIGSLEAESDIEDGGKRRKRIPLQRVAAVPIHAGIGTLPFAREAVLSVARLLDHERLKPETDQTTDAQDGLAREREHTYTGLDRYGDRLE